jgi:hypothetical protein
VSSPYVRFWYAITVSFGACVVTAVTAVLFAVHVQAQAQHRAEMERAESDRRWCALLTELDNAYEAPPGPTTETGRKVAAEIHQLRVGFGCS